MNLIITQPLLFRCWLWWSLHGTFEWRKMLPQMNHMFACWPNPMQQMHGNDWQNEPKTHHDYNSMITHYSFTVIWIGNLPPPSRSQTLALNWRPRSFKHAWETKLIILGWGCSDVGLNSNTTKPGLWTLDWTLAGLWTGYGLNYGLAFYFIDGSVQCLAQNQMFLA